MAKKKNTVSASPARMPTILPALARRRVTPGKRWGGRERDRLPRARRSRMTLLRLTGRCLPFAEKRCAMSSYPESVLMRTLLRGDRVPAVSDHNARPVAEDTTIVSGYRIPQGSARVVKLAWSRESHNDDSHALDRLKANVT